MSRATYRLILLFLALAFLAGTPGESLSSEPSFPPAGIIDVGEYIPEAEHTSDRLPWRHPVNSIAKRRIDTPASLVTRSHAPHLCNRKLDHPWPFCVAAVGQSIPLYQSLQMYRL
jgi:hypothetical protein